MEKEAMMKIECKKWTQLLRSSVISTFCLVTLKNAKVVPISLDCYKNYFASIAYFASKEEDLPREKASLMHLLFLKEFCKPAFCNVLKQSWICSDIPVVYIAILQDQYLSMYH